MRTSIIGAKRRGWLPCRKAAPRRRLRRFWPALPGSNTGGDELAVPLTDEQRAVVTATADVLSVIAKAGCGKTTTLVEFARARPRQRLLYLAFNKSVQAEASERFPANTTCRTTHAIAYRKAVQLFGQRVGAKIGSTRPSSVARKLGCSLLVAVAALDTLQRWFASADEAIAEAHIPPALREKSAAHASIVEAAKRTWACMLDPYDTEVRMSHDGYLKLFALDTPRLPPCDYILVDEAQDITAATYQIVSQQRARLVFVGDPWQAIYGFRGAINALALVRAERVLHLTESFRFGQGIAALANILLSEFKGDTRPIVGRGHPQQSIFGIEPGESFATIARTNASLFEAAVQHLSLDRPYLFVGGVSSYRFDKALDAYYLWRGQRRSVRDAYLRSFDSFQALQELGQATEDFELLGLSRVIETYGDAIPDLTEAIKRRAVDAPVAQAEALGALCFSTAHKAKGLEFRQVELTDDYMEFFDKSGRELTPLEIPPEAVNLLYVALTRARARLRICSTLQDWLNYRSDLKRRLRAVAPTPGRRPAASGTQGALVGNWSIRTSA